MIPVDLLTTKTVCKLTCSIVVFYVVAFGGYDEFRRWQIINQLETSEDLNATIRAHPDWIFYLPVPNHDLAILAIQEEPSLIGSISAIHRFRENPYHECDFLTKAIIKQPLAIKYLSMSRSTEARDQCLFSLWKIAATADPNLLSFSPTRYQPVLARLLSANS